MEPRKKDVMDYIVPIIGVLIAIFLALHMAMAYENVKNKAVNHDYMNENGEMVKNRTFNYGAFFSQVGKQLNKQPSNIKFVESTPKFLLGAGFICLIAIGYKWTSQKKFINGKEYGSSEWGKPEQIKKLRSKAIEKNEIREIKKSKKDRHEKDVEIKNIKEKYKSADIIFTQTEKICMYNKEINNNTLIIGGSGSGKTRGYVLPNILQCNKGKYSPSIIVTDPKGEIISKVGKYLVECGYDIKVLNLKEQSKSFCFNPFKYILDENFEEGISSLVSCIMNSRSEEKEQTNKDPFWDDMAKVLLKAIFYAIYEGFPEEERNMSTVMEVFRWFEISDDDNRYSNPTKLDKFFEVFGDKDGTLKVAKKINAFYIEYYTKYSKRVQYNTLPIDLKTIKEKIAIPLNSSNDVEINKYKEEINYIIKIIRENEFEMKEILELSNKAITEIDKYKEERQNSYYGMEKPIGVVMYEKYGDVNVNPALRNWEDFRTKCKGKTAQSVTATALAKLSPFDEKEIRRIFSKDEMELDLVGERKTAIFVVLPPTNETYNFIANVFYTQLFEQLEYCATVKHNQQLPVPVRFILDEFYNTGKIPNFKNILSYARSFGISISIILQSLDQIKEMYEKSWGLIVDNCSTILYLGAIKHSETLEYISKLLGKGTFDKKTYSRTKGRQSSSSTSFDKIGRDLLDPAEIQKIDRKKCLLFVSGCNPYFSNKFNYKTHINYKKTSDFNKKNLYTYKLPEDTHREENCKKKKGIDLKKEVNVSKSELLAIDENVKETMEFLNNNILNLSIDGEEQYIEQAETDIDTILATIVNDEEIRNKEFDEEVEKKFLSLNTNIKDINETINEFIENKENIDYDDIQIVEDEDDSDNELNIDLDKVEFAINSLKEDMIDDGFFEELSNVDLEILPD